MGKKNFLFVFTLQEFGTLYKTQTNIQTLQIGSMHRMRVVADCNDPGPTKQDECCDKAVESVLVYIWTCQDDLNMLLLLWQQHFR